MAQATYPRLEAAVCSAVADQCSASVQRMMPKCTPLDVVSRFAAVSLLDKTERQTAVLAGSLPISVYV